MKRTNSQRATRGLGPVPLIVAALPFAGWAVSGCGDMLVDRGSGSNGSPLKQRPCSGTEEQVFDYYFKTY